ALLPAEDLGHHRRRNNIGHAAEPHFSSRFTGSLSDGFRKCFHRTITRVKRNENVCFRLWHRHNSSSIREDARDLSEGLKKSDAGRAAETAPPAGRFTGIRYNRCDSAMKFQSFLKLAFVVAATPFVFHAATDPDAARQEQHARAVTII